MGRGVARKRALDLSLLEHTPAGDFRLGSLADGRLEGLAHRYAIIRPLASEETGDELFS